MGLAGNQGNRVSIIPFNAAELSYWWPSYWRDKQCVIADTQRNDLAEWQAYGRVVAEMADK